MAIYVPDTNTFSLADVVAAVEDHAGELPGDDSLSGCFTYSIDGYFDSAYKGVKDRLSNFRNYGPSALCMINNVSHVFSKTIGNLIVNDPTGIFFKPDGSRAFIIGSKNCVIAEYSMSTAWDISGLTHVKSASLNRVPGPEHPYHGVHFDSTGTKLFVVNSYDHQVEAYSLSTAWNISTLSYVASCPIPTLYLTQVMGVWLNPTGTELWVSGDYGGNQAIVKHTLSFAFHIGSGVNYVGRYTAGGASITSDLVLNSTRTKVWWGLTVYNVNQGDMTTAGDISTLDFTCSFLHSIAYAYGLFIDSTISRLYITEGNRFSNIYKVHQYNIN